MQNLLYKEDQKPCLPPYDDFYIYLDRNRIYGTKDCFDVQAYYDSEEPENIPLIMQCYTGITPYYCPMELD